VILVLLAALLAGSGCASMVRAPSSSPPAAPAGGAPAGATPGSGRELEEVTRRLDVLGSRSGDLENVIARVGARVEALERRLDALAAQLAHARASRAPSAAGGEPAPAVPAPEAETRGSGEPRAGGAPGAPAPSARELYQDGMAKHRAGEAAPAVLIFYDLIARYPTDPLRENAQFQVGEIFFREREFREALREFEDLLAAVPSGARTADVLLKIGLCYRSLKDEAGARQAWERLTREYPASAAGRQARVLLRSPRPR
jgi:TolA-binding protein